MSWHLENEKTSYTDVPFSQSSCINLNPFVLIFIHPSEINHSFILTFTTHLSLSLLPQYNNPSSWLLSRYKASVSFYFTTQLFSVRKSYHWLCPVCAICAICAIFVCGQISFVSIPCLPQEAVRKLSVLRWSRSPSTAMGNKSASLCRNWYVF